MDFLKYIAIFGAGVVAGAFVAHTMCRHYYEQYADDRIKDLEDYISDLEGRNEPKKHVVGNDKPVDKPSTTTKASYTDYIEKEKEKIMTQYNSMAKVYDTAADISEEQKEQANRAIAVPEEGLDIYEIDEELYSTSEMRYDKEALHWYPENDPPVLADDSNYIFDEYNLIKEAKKYLDECKDDGDIIYIRNETIEADYEITTHLGKFTG